MYYFFRSWRDSLSLFMPQNAKLFSLVTLKSILNSYRIIFKDLWWLLLLAWATGYGIKNGWIGLIRGQLLQLFVWLIIIFIIYLIIRPSLPRKNWGYYGSKWPLFFYFVPLSLLALALPFIFLRLATEVGLWAITIQPLFYYLYLLIVWLPVGLAFIAAPEVLPIYSSPLLSFIFLFLFDSRGTPLDLLKSIWRALKMVMYNWPFCAIVYTVLLFGAYYLQIGIYKLLGTHTFLSSTLVGTLALVIPLCLWTMFYTKRLHDQFNLYFPESVKE